MLKQVGEMLKKATSDKLREMEEDVQNWEGEVSRLQQLIPLQITISRLRQVDIPALEKQSKEVQIGQPGTVAEAEAALERLDAARQAQKSLQTLKQQVSGIVRLTHESKTLETEIQSLESSLRATGSTKTADDLQAELSQIQTQRYDKFLECAVSIQTSSPSRTLEREKDALMADRDRQSINLRSEEDRYHILQIREGELRNNMNALENTKLRINLGTKEIEEHQIAIKVRQYVFYHCVFHQIGSIRILKSKFPMPLDRSRKLMRSNGPINLRWRARCPQNDKSCKI